MKVIRNLCARVISVSFRSVLQQLRVKPLSSHVHLHKQVVMMDNDFYHTILQYKNASFKVSYTEKMS